MGYRLTNNTYFKRVKDDIDDAIDVEIGDSTSTSFRPHLKLNRWDGEVGFSIEFPSALSGATRTVDDVNEIITWKRGDYTLKWYPHQDLVKHPDGAFEFEIILGKKPPTNKFTLNFESKGLEAFYQPPLNQEPMPEGGVLATETDIFDIDGNVIAHRPPEIVGSYAIYYKDPPKNVVGGKKYRTGKAFHIERPQLTDANGDVSWATMDLNGQAKTLTITADATWLANAVYPVIVDPTFGYSSVGATNSSVNANGIYFSKYTTAEAGTLSKITAHIKHDMGTGQRWQTALYSISGTTATWICNSATGYSTTTFAWVDFPQTGDFGIGDYLLAENASSETTPTRMMAYDSIASSAAFKSQTFGTWAASYTSVSFGVSRRYSIYATYATGGTNGSVTSVVSTSPASMPIPVVTGEIGAVDVSLTSVSTNADASAIISVISGTASVTGVVGSTSAISIIPTITANANITEVLSNSSALMPSPVITGTTVINVGVTSVVSTANSSGIIPTLTASANVTDIVTNSSAIMPISTLSGTSNVSVIVGTSVTNGIVSVISGNASIIGIVTNANASTVVPVASGIINSNIISVSAVANAIGLSPAISGIRNASITSIVAVSNASNISPTVSGIRNSEIISVSTDASALITSPVVSGIRNASVVSVVATSVASSGDHAAYGLESSNVLAVRTIASASGITPTVSGIQNISIVSVSTNANALSLDPIVSVSNGTTVISVVATASASSASSVITGIRNIGINSVVSNANALLIVPAVSSSIIVSVTVNSPVSSVNASGLLPNISGNAIVNDITGLLISNGISPIIYADANIFGIAGTANALGIATGTNDLPLEYLRLVVFINLAIKHNINLNQNLGNTRISRKERRNVFV